MNALKSWATSPTRRSASVSSSARTSARTWSTVYPSAGASVQPAPRRSGREHAVALGERRDDLAPLPPVLGAAVQEQDRRGIRVPGLGDVHPQASRERDERMGHARKLRHLGRLRAARRRAPWGASGASVRTPLYYIRTANSPPATCGAGPWFTMDG
jgi:hypothetical protein